MGSGWEEGRLENLPLGPLSFGSGRSCARVEGLLASWLGSHKHLLKRKLPRKGGGTIYLNHCNTSPSSQVYLEPQITIFAASEGSTVVTPSVLRPLKWLRNT
ncbi:hypothetical protein D4764_17G0002540 [Takifugu flavidus]|uniref:Uncharacterized protein n=1 Tax=Takifugu flavidus TaxID=433684 RepID=A0A5C6NW16_9TELE|nr:hypothetical protein D4764_17G0002540 [Takifugu flavidus]